MIFYPLFQHSNLPIFRIGFLGDHGEGETPVPIPNTVVKPSSADGTAWETVWESRTPPEFHSEGLPGIDLEGLSFSMQRNRIGSIAPHRWREYAPWRLGATAAQARRPLAMRCSTRGGRRRDSARSKRVARSSRTLPMRSSGRSASIFHLRNSNTKRRRSTCL